MFADLLTEGYEPHDVKRLYIHGTDKVNTWVDISETLEIKVKALQQHVSQIDPIAGRLVYSSLLGDASGHVQGLVARGDGLGGVFVLGRTTATRLGGSTRGTSDWDLYLARWSLLLGVRTWF